jgi:hypothetical protein
MDTTKILNYVNTSSNIQRSNETTEKKYVKDRKKAVISAIKNE